MPKTIKHHKNRFCWWKKRPCEATSARSNGVCKKQPWGPWGALGALGLIISLFSFYAAALWGAPPVQFTLFALATTAASTISINCLYLIASLLRSSGLCSKCVLIPVFATWGSNLVCTVCPWAQGRATRLLTLGLEKDCIFDAEEYYTEEARLPGLPAMW